MRSKIFLLALAPAVLLSSARPSWGANGSAFFSSTINWPQTPPLYYTVADGPAHTCGDLWAKRNSGLWKLEASGWLCTDGSGDAVKGPWYWNNQSGDETADVYIKWPDGTSTNTARHIWDKTAPNVPKINTPTATPPTSFSGTAKDVAWGAGFSSGWAQCLISYTDNATGQQWIPGKALYSVTTTTFVPCTFSGMPSLSVSWTATAVPPASAHYPGGCYTWYVWVYDGGLWNYGYHSFCT